MAVEGPVSGVAIARTYDPRSHADAWELVCEYRDVMAYHNDNPEEGPYVVAGEFDLPAERVRAWFGGSKPDPIRGLDRAAERGWLDVGFDDVTFRGLSVLVAWVFSGGSINQAYVPHFVVKDEAGEECLKRAAAAIDAEFDFMRRADPQRATEFRPIGDASVLGRVLAALGAPVGSKNEETALALPQYLDAAPGRVRREFVRAYLHNRGGLTGDRTVQESRPPGYLDALADLVRETTGEGATLAERTITVSAAAAAEIEGWEPVLGDVAGSGRA